MGTLQSSLVALLSYDSSAVVKGGHLLRSNPERSAPYAGMQPGMRRAGSLAYDAGAVAWWHCCPMLCARSVQHMDLCALLFRLDRKALLR